MSEERLIRHERSAPSLLALLLHSLQPSLSLLTRSPGDHGLVLLLPLLDLVGVRVDADVLAGAGEEGLVVADAVGASERERIEDRR